MFLYTWQKPWGHNNLQTAGSIRGLKMNSSKHNLLDSRKQRDELPQKATATGDVLEITQMGQNQSHVRKMVLNPILKVFRGHNVFQH